MTALARLRARAALTAVAAATVVSLTACAFAPTGSDAGSAPATEGASADRHGRKAHHRHGRARVLAVGRERRPRLG